MERFDAWAAQNPGAIAPPAEVAYDFFAEFTRRYVGCFLNGVGTLVGLQYTMRDAPDVRAYPIHEVRVGDPLHRAALGFARAQVTRRCTPLRAAAQGATGLREAPRAPAIRLPWLSAASQGRRTRYSGRARSGGSCA